MKWIHNPYTPENLEKEKIARRERVALLEKQQREKHTLELLMSAQKAQCKKAHPTEKNPKFVLRAKKAVITRNANKAARAKSTQEDEGIREESILAAATSQQGMLEGTFRPTSLKIYTELQIFLKDRVRFEENGAHQFVGRWPAEIGGLMVDPVADPYHFFYNAPLNRDPGTLLSPSDFACRPIMFWAPECRWPEFYPDNRPCCPFHAGNTSCVLHNGWGGYVRRVFDEHGITGLIGRRYICKIQREKASEENSMFYSYDAGVVSQAPPYVQGIWRQHGCRTTTRGAVRWTLIEQMRSQLAHGMSALGFRNALCERYKQAHAMDAKKWRSYCELMKAKKRIIEKRLFFPFDDPRSEYTLPSLNYLLRVTLEEIESHVPYYRHKMTMNGGNFLSGDHFIKIGKVVLIDNERGFVGMYSVMNEYGHILLFRLVNGTTLNEVEGSLRGLNRRYKLHGFKGPIIFTTDRCCQERSFYEGSSNQEKSPIFDSFVVHSFDPDPGTSTQYSTTSAQYSTTRTVQYLTMNQSPTTFSSNEVADATANDIIASCQRNEWAVVSLDSEWTVAMARTKKGPDTIQITTQGLDTYIFQRPFPKGLVTLLESPDIKKVACSISADRTKLAEIGVTLQGEVNLQHMAKDRGVLPTATGSLGKIFSALFGGIELEKDQSIRISNWSGPLSDKHIEYAALDSYSQMLCYLKMTAMPYVDPTETTAPRANNLKEGDKLLLYTPNKSSVVAEATYVGLADSHLFFNQKSNKCAKFQITCIRRPAAKATQMQGKTLEELKAAIPAHEPLEVKWLLNHTRVQPEGGVFEPILSTKSKEVATDPVLAMGGETDASSEPLQLAMTAEASPPNDLSMSEDEDDAGGNDTLDDEPHTRLDDHGFSEDHQDPYTTNFYFKGGHTKQDIEHIFIRFARVLSKKHGAFGSFMARLSDAFFVASYLDVSFLKAALKEKGNMTDDEINSLPWHYFRKRVRRTVPGPVELEKQFNAVVNLFANVKDNKTGKPLFGRKAWNLYKSTLRHIRKGCLSDIPGLSYYVQIGTDSLGVPLFKCLRGTSALEGFHQKIRQLLRGFNISPRFVVALLYEFVHRWNHDVDIRLLGLPSRYAHFYDGWEIEEEVEAGCGWEELVEPPHPKFECTKYFASTGEDFGLIAGEYDTSTEDLDQAVGRIEDSFKDGSWDALVNNASNEESSERMQELTASAAWVAGKLGRKRGVRKVITDCEKEFFRKHYTRFQGGSTSATDGLTDEADNFTSIRWGKFTCFWNAWVKDEEDERRPASDMTYKTAFLLMDFYQEMKKAGNVAATLLPVLNQNKGLRRALRGQDRCSDVSFDEEAPKIMVASNAAERRQKRASVEMNNPFPAMMDLPPIEEREEDDVQFSVFQDEEEESAPEARRIVVAAFAGQTPVEPAQYVEANAFLEPQMKKRRLPKRCRECGYCKLDCHWTDYHPKPKQKQSGKFFECRTPEHQRKRGFPVDQTKRMDNIPWEPEPGDDNTNE